MSDLALRRSDQQITYLMQASAALARASRAGEVKKIADAAAAAEVYAKRQQLSEETIGLAHALKIDALAKLGTILKATPKAAGTRSQQLPAGPGRGKKTGGTKVVPPVSTAPTLRELGISKKTSTMAQQLAALDEPTRRAVAGRTTRLGAALRAARQRRAKVAAASLEPPPGVYEVLVVDPPWQYDRQPKDSELRGECEYPTMTLDELKGFPLAAAKDCVLWLWTTNSFMGEAYDLLDAWKFTPKTILTWDKVHLGLGHWLRNVTEHCILAVRGHPTVQLTTETTIIREPRRTHSRKPEAFYALVETLCIGRKCEYFLRGAPRPEWTGYGLEATAPTTGADRLAGKQRRS